MRIGPGAQAVVVALTLYAAPPLAAQREYYGLSASLGAAHTRLSFDSSDARSRWGANLRFGVRICGLCWRDVPNLTITPSVGFAATDVRGMTRRKDPYAFSRLDFGAQLAWRVAPALRPYAVLWLRNKRTAEIERDTTTLAFGEANPSGLNAWPVNFVDVDGDMTVTWGVEIPVTKGGRGFDLSFTRVSGRFTTAEFRKLTPAVSLGYSGWTVSLGYTGPFTGATPPWK